MYQCHWHKQNNSEAAHHAIATRQVHHTETIAIWKFHFISSFRSECEITWEVVWADMLKDGCLSLLYQCHWHKKEF